MKRNTNLLRALFFILIGLNAYSQIGIFGDEDDDVVNELQNVSYDEFFNVYVGILDKGEAGPLGNWMSGSLQIMLSPRFANAPKEYSCAFIIKTKELRMLTYEAMLDQLDLSCVEKKKVIESYIMFLGTLYLDMFSMDFFLDNALNSNQLFNSSMVGFYDAEQYFETGKYNRGIFSHAIYCDNDLTDSDITDCAFSEPMTDYEQEKHRRTIEKTLKKLNPGNVAQKLMDLQSMLKSLPCK